MGFFSGGIPTRSVAEKGADTAFAMTAEAISLAQAHFLSTGGSWLEVLYRWMLTQGFLTTEKKWDD